MSRVNLKYANRAVNNRGVPHIAVFPLSTPASRTRSPEQGKEAEQRLGWGPSVIGGVLPAEHPVRPTHGIPGKYHVAGGASRSIADTSPC